MTPGRLIIATAYIPGGVRAVYAPEPGDYVICADGGYSLCATAGVDADAFIGDFDSLDPQTVDCPMSIAVPVEKDDTDTMLCLKHGLNLGYRDILILGGIGGRLDHTIANLQTLAYAHENGAAARLVGLDNEAFLIPPGQTRVPRREGFKFSLFAYTERCTGVFVEGVQYPLKGASLTQSFPLGVSNVIEGAAAIIRVKTGLLLCVLSRD